jgi:hemolysin activation/secretion protein
VNTYDLSLVGGRIRYPDGRNPALDDDPSFTKLTYAYSRLQDWITGRALVYFALRGQYAANNLDTTEQFRLGGADGVRAYAAGDGTGDIGSLATLELRLLPPESWFGRFAREMVFSAFIDGGYVQYRYRPAVSSDPTAAPNHATYSGVGLGLVWVRGNEYTLRLSVSKPVTSTLSSDGQQRKPRVYLQAARLFN